MTAKVNGPSPECAFIFTVLWQKIARQSKCEGVTTTTTTTTTTVLEFSYQIATNLLDNCCKQMHISSIEKFRQISIKRMVFMIRKNVNRITVAVHKMLSVVRNKTRRLCTY